MTTSQNIDSIFSSPEDNKEELENKIETLRLTGHLIAMERMKLFSLSQLGDILRTSKINENAYAVMIYSQSIKGNDEYANLLIQLINELEALIRNGLSINNALEQLIDDGYLCKLEKLQKISKLN